MRVFISGPISGKPDFNKKAFNDAEQQLSDLGLAVWNPVKLHPAKPDRFSHDDYLWVCFSMIERSDVVALLSGWENSKGARAEKSFAQQKGLQVYSLDMLIDIAKATQASADVEDLRNRPQHYQEERQEE